MASETSVERNLHDLYATNCETRATTLDLPALLFTDFGHRPPITLNWY